MWLVFGWLSLTVLAILSAFTTIGFISWIVVNLNEYDFVLKFRHWFYFAGLVMITVCIAFSAWTCNHYAYYAYYA